MQMSRVSRCGGWLMCEMSLTFFDDAGCAEFGLGKWEARTCSKQMFGRPLRHVPWTVDSDGAPIQVRKSPRDGQLLFYRPADTFSILKPLCMCALKLSSCTSQ